MEFPQFRARARHSFRRAPISQVEAAKLKQSSSASQDRMTTHHAPFADRAADLAGNSTD
jgi:hypothetical protein